MPIWLAALVLALWVSEAQAGPQCTSEPAAKWLSQEVMRSKLEGLGYVFKTIKVTDGNCYEIYGRDKTGKRVEIYFNPISGDAVEEHKG